MFSQFHLCLDFSDVNMLLRELLNYWVFIGLASSVLCAVQRRHDMQIYAQVHVCMSTCVSYIQSLFAVLSGIGRIVASSWDAVAEVQLEERTLNGGILQ
uniref:Bestrophin homolog n=1 Tax=Parascaris univalens TaxID=6257 RepID=A0A914ZTE6_PARUN